MNVNYMLFIKFVLVILFVIIISQKAIKLTINLLKNAGCTIKNYRGIEVVFGMGVFFVPVLITSIAFTLLLYSRDYFIYVPFLFAICVIGFAGFMDDLIGNKQVKGLRKHILSFKKGELTTGFIKAFIGLISSFVISYGISITVIDFILNIFIIALFTNALNLLDLRPGRCIKAFLLIGSIIVIGNITDFLLLLPLFSMLTASIIYLSYDLKEIGMLGDTGSNILGVTLGYFSSIAFDITGKIIIFLTLIIINALAEKISITKLISSNRLLNYLDSLGRSSG